MHPALGGQDQRVDLHQVGVALDVGRVQLLNDGHRALYSGLRQGCRSHPVAGGGLIQTVHGINPDLGDCIRVLVGHRLDFHSTLGREHS